MTAFLPQKLALLVGELEANPEIGLIAGQALPIDEHGHQVGEKFDRPLPAVPSHLLLGNPLHVGSGSTSSRMAGIGRLFR